MSELNYCIKSKQDIIYLYLLSVYIMVFSVYQFLLWWLSEYEYTLSHNHHQIGSMNFYPLSRVRSWNNGVCCMSFYILMILNLHPNKWLSKQSRRRWFETSSCTLWCHSNVCFVSHSVNIYRYVLIWNWMWRKSGIWKYRIVDSMDK